MKIDETGREITRRELTTGLELVSSEGRIELLDAAPGLIVQTMEGKMTEALLGQSLAWVQDRLDFHGRISIAYDVRQITSYEPAGRQLYNKWLFDHADLLDKMVLLVATPLMQLAVRTFNTISRKLRFTVFHDIDKYQAAIDEAVFAAVESMPAAVEPTAADSIEETSSNTLVDSAPRMRTAHTLGNILGGAYRLDKKIGEGGMGTVYRSVQLSLGRQVAVKVLRDDRYANADSQARFRREIDASSRLSHPNLVRVIDGGETEDGARYFVMELLEGETLEDFVPEGGLNIEILAPLFDQLCAGVAAVHRAGLIHRDIKPANVFVTELDGAPQIKVLDFGIAKHEIHRDSPDLTGDGQLLGTPGFISPEQISGASEPDARADVYAIGSVLYFMATGKRAFAGRTSMLVMNHQLSGEYERLDGDLGEIVGRALEVDRADRYSSVYVLRTAFRDALRGTIAPSELSMTGVQAPLQAPPEADRSVEKLRLLIALVAIVAVTVLTLVLFLKL